MRIGDNGNRAVTVIENVFGGHAFNRFNFHVRNTAHSPAFTQFGSVTISALPATPAAYPLSMCARITGDLVQFIVWTSGSRPAWGDREWGGQAVLPTSAPRSGQTGFYVGHLMAGSSLTYSGLTVDGQMNDPTS